MKRTLLFVFSFLFLLSDSLGVCFLFSSLNSLHSDKRGGEFGTSQNESIVLNAKEPNNPNENWINHCADSFAGGSGTADDPYLISTAGQLALLAFNVNSGTTYLNIYFSQTKDIDLSAYYWTSIGKDKNFSGIYDGLSHTIKGVYTQNGQNYQGIFGRILDAEIKNIFLEDSLIQGSDYVGGIVGFCSSSKILNCKNDSDVIGEGSTGGIVGYTINSSLVQGCENTGDVSSKRYVGGIVGYNICEVKDCLNSGNIYGEINENSSVGGVIGHNNNGEVSDLTNFGNVSNKHIQHQDGDIIAIGGVLGDNYYGTASKLFNYGIVCGCGNLGGVLGRNDVAVLENSYNLGTVLANFDQYLAVGGVVGNNFNNATVNNVYNAGRVQSEYDLVGGVVGRNSNSSVIKNSFNVASLDVDTTFSKVGGVVGENLANCVVTNSYYGGDCENIGGVSRVDIEGQAEYLATIKSDAQNVEWYSSSIWNSESPWQFGDIWTIHPWANQALPYFQGSVVEEYMPENVDYMWTDEEVRSEIKTTFEGSGTADDPYLISTPSELAGLAYNANFGGQTYAGKYFKQTADIDVSKYWWDAIGTNALSFRGNYDGDNHTVSGIFTPYGETDEYANQGFFGLMKGLNSTIDVGIKNIIVVNSLIQGERAVAGIVGGAHYITISNCHNFGIILGNEDNVGGIIGFSSSSNIINSSNHNRVYGGINVGGIAGYAAYLSSISKRNEIENTWNKGSVYAQINTGGIVGHNVTSDACNVYNFGNIYGERANVGGIFGASSSNGLVSNAFNGGKIQSFTGGSGAGGIVGNIGASQVINTFNVGMVIAQANTGGIIGLVNTEDENSTILNSYYGGDYENIGGINSTDVEGQAEYLGTIETDAKTKEWFVDNTAGTWNSEYPWDFTYTWKVNPAENEGYPTLYQYSLPKTDYMWTDEEVRSEIKTTFEGSGTADDPYLISTPSELAGLAYNVNFGGQRYAGKYFKQTADIDVSKYWWDAIGTGKSRFSGNYDGGNHTISGLFTPYGETDEFSGQGLFGYAHSNLSEIEIKNVRIKNSLIQGYSQVGGVVGYIQWAIVSNCSNEADIVGIHYQNGGIIGYAHTTTVINCQNFGTVMSPSRTGGIVGFVVANASYLVTECQNSGAVIGSDFAVGGIIGYNMNSTVSYCNNSGYIYSDDRPGGIAGVNQTLDQNRSVIKYSYNTGNVQGKNPGGIVGINEGENSFITDCYNLGDISGTANVGGIAGMNYTGATISNCYNLGSITSKTSMAGGIVGNDFNSGKVYSCFNLGGVTGKNYIGGIIGYVNGSYNSYYGGDCENIGGINGADVEGQAEYLENIAIEAKTGDFYLNASLWNENYPWDFLYTWTFDENVNDGYPIFKKISITYHSNNGEEKSFQEEYFASSVTIANNPYEKEGYVFAGWNTLENGNGQIYGQNEDCQISSTIDLYAQWQPEIFEISLNHQNGSGEISKIYEKYNTGFYSNDAGTNVITKLASLPTRVGYEFLGYYTDKNGGGNVVIDETGVIVATTSFTTTDTEIFAYWKAKNLAQQDENGKWYVEMGYFPQTKVSDASLISSLDAERTNGNEISKTYTISGHTLKVYTFAGEEYAYLDLTGCYYKVEPVRYVLAGEHSAGDATESGSVTAVSEKIVFASVFQTGWLTSDCFGKGYANAVISTNVSGFLSNSLANGEYLNTPTYSVTNFKTATGGKSSTNLSVQAIASNRSEIQSVFGDLSAEFSDLVADLLGGYLAYWTRDVGSNLLNAQTISAGGTTGTQMKMSELLGVRVTVNIKTLACAG